MIYPEGQVVVSPEEALRRHREGLAVYLEDDNLSPGIRYRRPEPDDDTLAMVFDIKTEFDLHEIHIHFLPPS